MNYRNNNIINFAIFTFTIVVIMPTIHVSEETHTELRKDKGELLAKMVVTGLLTKL